MSEIPKRPLKLPLLALKILERFQKLKESDAQSVIIGGGIALKHYLDKRETQDIDAWWKNGKNESGFLAIKEAMKSIADEANLLMTIRSFGVTDSFELKDKKSGNKIFSFQIATRDKQLEKPHLSPWAPLLIESLVDNVASKMNALVNRGAPRDFVDIYNVVESGILSIGRCWEVWKLKNPDGIERVAKDSISTHLNRLNIKRPLEKIDIMEERENAKRLRDWFGDKFLV